MQNKELEVITIGYPSFEHLEKTEANVFCFTLLSLILEWKKNEEEKGE